MKITFLMPCYMWGPSGGFRIVYEYANQLVVRGHQVAVVHPRRLKPPVKEQMTFRKYLRKGRLFAKEVFSRPAIYWHPIDPRVNVLYVPSSDQKYIPDADVIFATAWHTVRSVLEYPETKGRKCYLIQGYETFLGPQDLVDETWRAPLHKVAIARWLAQLGKQLGAEDITYIPNAVDFQHYRVITPIEQRPLQVVMAYSPVPIKGAADGIKALEIAKRRFPELHVKLFGVSRPATSLPLWMEYSQNPPQGYIVRELYNCSRVFVSPSCSEGFPLPPAEAAACGCAIVSTDIGGIREYVQHGVTGLLSPPKDVEALAANICLLLENDALRIRLAHAANHLIGRFTWNNSTDLMEQFLTRVVQMRESESVAYLQLETLHPLAANVTGGITSATRES